MILHIVYNDKFTDGYINYMRLKQQQWEHHFIVVTEGKFPQAKADETDILYLEQYTDILTNKQSVALTRQASEIVISGVFGISRILLFLPRWFVKKAIFQFWGGDFYYYKKRKKNLKYLYKYYSLRKCLTHSLGVINLIDTDYTALMEISGLTGISHYVAPMPGNPLDVVDYSKYILPLEKKDVVRVWVGNSATPENCHAELFDMLLHLKEHVEILCPLSYGNETYQSEVIELGKKLFGERFSPITEYVSKGRYVEMISTCQVGLFNNNRQQAMGNISISMFLGNKVYLRRGTSMWDFYKNHGFCVYDIAEIKDASLDSLQEYSEAERQQNLEAKRAQGAQTDMQWSTVFSITEQKPTIEKT